MQQLGHVAGRAGAGCGAWNLDARYREVNYVRHLAGGGDTFAQRSGAQGVARHSAANDLRKVAH